MLTGTVTSPSSCPHLHPPPCPLTVGKMLLNRNCGVRLGYIGSHLPRWMRSSQSPLRRLWRRQINKVGTQLTLNSFPDSFIESGCQSFRITDSIHMTYQKSKAVTHSLIYFTFCLKTRDCSGHWGYSVESARQVPCSHEVDTLDWDLLSSLRWHSSMGDPRWLG